jgi:UDP-glucose 4-epimerase
VAIYGSGKQIRDFVYVDDVVNANLLSLKLSSNFAEPINIASAKPTSILDLFNAVKKKTGYGKGPVFKERREGDVGYSLANIGKARELLNFHPKYPLEKGLDKTISSLKA